ncbi:hypothetical protein [Streptomyces sp. NPDC048419]|uniref:hypothetical protein n=1 Tax=Streptomyces sp. NPDC048419 TaxID=3365547 RepID=UPI0037195F2A
MDDSVGAVGPHAALDTEGLAHLLLHDSQMAPRLVDSCRAALSSSWSYGVVAAVRLSSP